MVLFSRDVAAKASGALLILFAMVAPGKPFDSLATQATLAITTTSSLSVQASGRSAMQASASSRPMSTAISEQAEMKPECLRSIFRFKSNNSYSWKQATPTASGKCLGCFIRRAMFASCGEIKHHLGRFSFSHGFPFPDRKKTTPRMKTKCEHKTFGGTRNF
jgi:hypothetical protein